MMNQWKNFNNEMKRKGLMPEYRLLLSMCLILVIGVVYVAWDIVSLMNNLRDFGSEKEKRWYSLGFQLERLPITGTNLEDLPSRVRSAPYLRSYRALNQFVQDRVKPHRVVSSLPDLKKLTNEDLNTLRHLVSDLNKVSAEKIIAFTLTKEGTNMVPNYRKLRYLHSTLMTMALKSEEETWTLQLLLTAPRIHALVNRSGGVLISKVIAMSMRRDLMRTVRELVDGQKLSKKSVQSFLKDWELFDAFDPGFETTIYSEFRMGTLVFARMYQRNPVAATVLQLIYGDVMAQYYKILMDKDFLMGKKEFRTKGVYEMHPILWIAIPNFKLAYKKYKDFCAQEDLFLAGLRSYSELEKPLEGLLECKFIPQENEIFPACISKELATSIKLEHFSSRIAARNNFDLYHSKTIEAAK